MIEMKSEKNGELIGMIGKRTERTEMFKMFEKRIGRTENLDLLKSHFCHIVLRSFGWWSDKGRFYYF